MHYMDDGDGSHSLSEGINQTGRGTLLIKGADIPGAFPQIIVASTFVVAFIFTNLF